MLRWLLLCLLFAGVEPQRRKRQAVPLKEQLWPSATVPYRINFRFTGAELQNIRRAMQEWSTFTCVKFQQLPPSSSQHAAIFGRTDKGCFSTTGYDGTDPANQVINLGVDCMDADIVIHELGHTLGLLHEHERIDRDRFVRISAADVQKNYFDQFRIDPNQKTYGLPYSYRSIMHYGKDHFNKKGRVAIQALDKKYFDLIGNAPHISFRDAWIVNKMYSCSSHCRSVPTCPPGAFVGKNCRCWCPHTEYTAVDCATKRAIDEKRIINKKGRIVRNPGSGSILFWSEFEVDWFAARAQCEAMGGALLAAKDPPAAREVAANMRQLLAQNYEPPGSNFQEILWTGGNDVGREGRYQWLDGSPINPRRLEFSRGEPNNGGGLNEDCVAVFPNADDKTSVPLFTDHDCGKPLRYICKMDDPCHNLIPSCPYYRSIGSCRDTRTAAQCPRTCGKCSPRRPTNNNVPKVPTPTIFSSGDKGNAKQENNNDYYYYSDENNSDDIYVEGYSDN